MRLTRNSTQRELLVSTILCIATSLAGCGQVTSLPTAAVEKIPTITLAPASTITQTLTAIPLPTCTPLPATYIFVIDKSVYNNVDAGIELGVNPKDGLQQALDEHHPDWGQEEDLASDVWSYSGAQNIGINPRVLLVTTGVALDWQIPENHDLKENIIQTGVVLTQHYREFRFNEEFQANYPYVADAANYALYAFFDFDLEKLNAWQQEYDRMFGDIQPRITVEGCQITTQSSVQLFSTPQLIDQAFFKGEITSEERLLYLAYAIFEPNSLPSQFRSNVGWRGTSVLMELNSATNDPVVFCSMRSDIRAELQRLLMLNTTCE